MVGLGSLTATSVGASSLTVNTAISIVMLMVSIAKYLPQIRRILTSRSVLGLAPAAYYGDSLVFCTKSVYHLRRGHPITAWGELLIIFAQNVVISGLIHKLRVPPSGRLPVIRDIFALLAFIFCLSRVPNRLLPLLSAFTAPLLIVSYTAQLWTNTRRRSTGQLSPGTVMLRLFGSTVRFITTITQLGGELPVLVNHAIGLGGCSLLLAQIWWYSADGPGSKTAEPEPLIPSPARPVAPASLYSATLLWRSLGGFGTDEQRRPSKAQLRAAFDALDSDGDGTLTVEEVAAGLAVSNPAVSLKGVQRMVDYADADNNGMIDFEEFSRVILLSGMYNTISAYPVMGSIGW